ncbi:MAG TPA: pyridoxal-phosphate dependent enzyme [Candidatus Limnocylindria bacterium]
MPSPTVDAAAIADARGRIPAAFRDMPQFVSEPLSERLGASVVVKAETANPVGCFKGRGTWLAVAELVAAGTVGEGRGLVVASAGNFGQGVAYAARALRVPLTVYAATTANPAKVAAMRRLGAEVRLAGEDFDAARDGAAAHAGTGAAHLLVDGQDPWITIGAGTLAAELTDAIAAGDLPELAALYVPVGNGALIAGIGAWLAEHRPHVRLVGVQAERAPAMTLSWREHRAIETPSADTVADGIAARVPVPEALELMIRHVDDMLLVSEDDILAAQAELAAALPFSIETAAAAGWAAARRHAPPRPIGFVLTGGNVPPPA